MPIAPLAEGRMALSRDVARYITRIRRLAHGDRFVAFDPESKVEADAELAIDGAEVVAVVAPVRRASVLPSREVVLVQGIGKSDKVDAVIRDATELGVTTILPALTRRCVAERTTHAAQQRWRRIATDAARQCGRGDVPIIDAPRPFVEVVASQGQITTKIILDPGASSSFGEVIGRAPTASSVVVAIGPEGGFDEEEVAHAVHNGFSAVHFGSMILRTETAPTAVLGALLAFSQRSEP